MKKYLLCCISLLMVFCMIGCGSDAGKDKGTPVNSAPQKAAAATSPNKSMILVAYFSATGNSKQLAERTAMALNADIYEIRPARPYTSEDLNYNNENSRATMEQRNEKARPELADRNAPISDYETIVLAYPIWWSQAPRIMDTFMESYDFSGKNITAVCTSGGSDIGSSYDYLKNLTKVDANWKPGKCFSPHVSIQEIKAWYDSLGF